MTSYIYYNESPNSKYYERKKEDIWELTEDMIVQYAAGELYIIWSLPIQQVANLNDYTMNTDTGEATILRSGMYSVTVTYVLTIPTSLTQKAYYLISRLSIKRVHKILVESYNWDAKGTDYAIDDTTIMLSYNHTGYFGVGDYFYYSIENYDSDLLNYIPVLKNNTRLRIIKIY